MPNKQPTTEHPFLDLFAAAMTPWMPLGPSHEKDPPRLKPLPGFTPPELRALLDHFVAADNDLRENRFTAAVRHLDLAETRIRLAQRDERAPNPAYEAALSDIALAREATTRGDTAHACGAVGDAVRALLAPLRRS